MSQQIFDRDRERHIVLGREVIRNEARALEEAANAITFQQMLEEGAEKEKMYYI